MNVTEETPRELLIDYKFTDTEVAILFSVCVFILPLLGNDCHHLMRFDMKTT